MADKKINIQQTTEYRNLLKEINFLRAQEDQTGQKILGTQKVWIDNAQKVIEEYNSMKEVSGEVADTSKDILKIMTKLIDPTTKNRKELEKILGVKGKQAGLDSDIQESIEGQVSASKSLNESWKEYLTRLKQSHGEAENIFDTLDGAVGGMGSKITKFLFNPLTAVFAIIAGAGALFKSYSNQVDLIGESFGATALQADGLKQEVFNINAEGAKLNILMKDLSGPLQTITEGFGMSQQSALRLAFDTTKMAKALGIGVDDSVGLVKQFKTITGLSLEQSIYQTKAFAMISKQKNVAPQAIMKDIAKSGEFFAKFSDQAGTNILDAAIAANKLGVNLSVVEQLSSNVLDFSSSIEKEMLASTVLGKRINFSDARRAFMNKDTLGAMQAIRKELSNIDLGALDPISLKIVADAFGTSAKDLKTMSNQSRDLAKFTKTTAESVANQGSEMKDLTADKALSEMTKMENTTRNISHILNKDMVPSFEKLDTVVNSLTNGIEMFASAISGIPLILGTVVAGIIAINMQIRRTSMMMGGMGGMGGMAMMGGATGGACNMMSFAGGGLGSKSIRSCKMGYNAKSGRWKKGGQFAKAPRGGSLLTNAGRGSKLLRGGLKMAKGTGWLAAASLGLDFIQNYQESGDLSEALLSTAKSNAGMLTGAAVGAGIGAWFGGIGAVPGALIGAGVGGAVDMFRGGYIQKDGQTYKFSDEDDVALFQASRMGIGPESALRKQNQMLNEQANKFSIASAPANQQVSSQQIADAVRNGLAGFTVSIKRDELNYVLTPNRA